METEIAAFVLVGMINRHKNDLLDYFDMYKMVEDLFENYSQKTAKKLENAKSVMGDLKMH